MRDYYHALGKKGSVAATDPFLDRPPWFKLIGRSFLSLKCLLLERHLDHLLMVVNERGKAVGNIRVSIEPGRGRWWWGGGLRYVCTDQLMSRTGLAALAAGQLIKNLSEDEAPTGSMFEERVLEFTPSDLLEEAEGEEEDLDAPVKPGRVEGALIDLEEEGAPLTGTLIDIGGESCSDPEEMPDHLRKYPLAKKLGEKVRRWAGGRLWLWGHPSRATGSVLGL